MKNRSKDYTINQIQPEVYQYVLDILSNLDPPINYSVFIYGTGKQSKGTYQKIEHYQGVEVIWFDFILTGIFKILRFFIDG